MNGITNGPNTYDFGHDFNYALWPSNTTVTLTNVKWNNDYRDIVGFDDRAALNDYIDNIESSSTTISNVSTLKANQPIRLDIPFNAALRYNYLRASNPLSIIPGDVRKDFYYFITDVRHIAGNTTEVFLQLDVWQTFGYDMKFGNSYIERGHIGIANENSFDSFGRDYLTIPEGLDVGGEYRVVAKRRKKIMGPWNGEADILIASTIRLADDDGTMADFGTKDDPDLDAATGSEFNGLSAGAEYYVFNSKSSFSTFMKYMSAYPWASQGIVSITMIPKMTRYFPDFEYRIPGLPTPVNSLPPITLTHSVLPNWRNDGQIVGNIPARYQFLKKFFTYPYMVIELTAWGATPVVLKPESWANADAKVIERISMVPPNQRVLFSPQSYNANVGAQIDKVYIPAAPGVPDIEYGDADDSGDYLDVTTMINNFPTMAMVNNGALAVLAAQAHSIAFQNSSADWSQTRAIRGSEVSYDQASAGMNLANDMYQIGRGADSSQTALTNQTIGTQAVIGAAGSVIGGVGGGAAGLAGGAANAAMGGLSAAVNINANQQALGIRNKAAGSANSSQQGTAGFMRDTNQSLATFSARGDYENTIAGINAKVQDIQLTPPSTSGQVGGEAMNLIHNNVELSVRFKMIDLAAIRSIGEYWLRYGYAVRQFALMPDSFHVMSKFTYWKLSETYIISAPMPEGIKQVIRGIFEKGVTVWKNPNDIGAIDLGTNVPLEGIVL